MNVFGGTYKYHIPGRYHELGTAMYFSLCMHAATGSDLCACNTHTRYNKNPPEKKKKNSMVYTVRT